MRFASSAKVHPHADGTLQQYINHPAAYLHPIPDSCSFEEASLIEPLSVVIHAARRAGFTAGQSVLVLGAGAVGLLGAALADANGAPRIACVDINQERVQFAVREGFVHKGHVLPIRAPVANPALALAQAKETASQIIAQTAPTNEGFDIVLECTGVESCMQIAIHVSLHARSLFKKCLRLAFVCSQCARTAGKVVYIGMGTPNALLPVSAAVFRE